MSATPLATDSTAKTIGIWLPLLCIAVLSAPFLLPFWILGDAWWDGYSDLGHFIAFGCIGATLTFFLRANGLSIAKSFVISALIILLLAVSTEAVQHFFHAERSGNVGDVLRNCSGALCMFSLMFAWQKSNTLLLRLVALLLAIVLSAIALKPTVIHFIDLEKKAQQMPTLFDYSQAWQREQVTAWKSRIIEPAAGESTINGYYQTATFEHHTSGSLQLGRVWPNWGGYQSLSTKLYADTDGAIVPVKFYLVFVSSQWQFKASWATINLSLRQGINNISIPLSSITFEGEPIDFDTVKVLSLNFAKHRTDRSLTLSLSTLELK